MNLTTRIVRRRLGLAPGRSEVLTSACAVAADDGARLDTRLLRASDPEQRRGVVLVRGERPLESAGPGLLLARFLAEDGATVVWQSVRGRGRSEGSFRPFADEIADGGATVRWIAAQPWFDGRLSLLGLGYAAHAAWAALAAAPVAVDAIVTAFGARDPYAWIHGGGGLQLEASLAMAAAWHDREGTEPGGLDLERAGRFLPVRESDRVAWRELPAFREWILHPERDDYWRSRTPALPERPPAVLQIAGWYEPALAAVLADHRALAGRTTAGDAAAPALCVGPWAAVPLPRRDRVRDAAPLGHVARTALRFLARAAGVPAPRAAPVRVHVWGAGWRALGQWPPERARCRILHLHGAGAAGSERGDGRLEAEPPAAGETADVFVSDPADPVPSCGGVAVAGAAGPAPQTDAQRRGDVLCFTSDAQPGPFEIAGHVRAELFVATSAEAADFTAKLSRVRADGVARWLAEGIAACDAGTPDTVRRIEIDLGSAAARVGTGERLRLEVASSSVPRFARHSQTAKSRAEFGRGEGRAARHTVFHDAARPSALRIDVVAGRAPAPDTEAGAGAPATGPGAGNEAGPPAEADGPARSPGRVS